MARIQTEDPAFMSGRDLSVSVKVTAFGMWQKALGLKSLNLETHAKTIQDLIDSLAKGDGNIKSEVLKPEGGLQDCYKIFINGRNCETLDHVIENGDDVILFSVIDGG